MLKEHSEIWVKRSGAIKYERYQTTFVPRAVIQRFDRIEVESEEFHRFVLTSSGELNPDDTSLRTWRPRVMDRSLISRAVQRECTWGVKLQGDVAVCPTNGGFATINLRTGMLLQLSPPIENMTWCKLIRTPVDIIGLCGRSAEVLGVVSGIATQRPKLERRFDEAEVAFFAGPKGTLLKEGSCNSTSIPGKDSRRSTAARLTLCIRSNNGLWRDLKVPDKDLRSRVKSLDDLHIQRWIPTVDGGAVGVIFGQLEGLLYAKPGRFLVVKKYFDGPRQNLARGGNWWMNDTFTLLSDGSIQGYSSDGSVRWMPNGTFKAWDTSLVSMAASGANALGVDSSGRMWQSTDYGEHWEEVSRPPTTKAVVVVDSCYPWGCTVGSWFRIGYPQEGGEFPYPSPLPLAPQLGAQVQSLMVIPPQSQHNLCVSK